MINPKLATRFDDRWPQGMIGRRGTRIVKNARIYLATPDKQIAKIGWGDLGLEQWHILRDIAADGLVLIAFENTHGSTSNRHDRSELADATLEDLIPGLALMLTRSTAVLLNAPASGRSTLGAVNLPAVDRAETRSWLAHRLAHITDLV